MPLNPEHGIAVFTDGSAEYKTREGGWAWVAIDAFGGVQSDAGYQADTTIGQMELYAVAKALDSLDEEYGSQDILVYSDSQYVVLGCKDRTRKRNKNREWWKKVDKAINYHCHVEFEHIYGHKGHKFNEMADQLAGEARKSKQVDS